MRLIYSELYGINNKVDNCYKYKGNCVPNLEIHYTNSEKEKLLNLNAEFIEPIDEDGDYNIAYLNFSFGLFSSLSYNTIQKLEVMLKFSHKAFQSDFINSNLWKAFLLTSNIKINPISKIIDSNITPYVKKNRRYKGSKGIFPSFYKDDRQKKLNNFFMSPDNCIDKNLPSIQMELYDDLLKNFIKVEYKGYKTNLLGPKYKIYLPENNSIQLNSMMRNGYFNSGVSINYEFEFNNEIELLYTFLDCLFSSEYKFCIKKCKNCETYFITLQPTKRHCSKCGDIVIKSRKLKFESKNIIKLERKINSLYTVLNISSPIRKQYFEDKKTTKALFQNDEKSLKEWFLNHYKTDEARKRNDYDIK